MTLAVSAIGGPCISQMTGDFMGHRGPVRIKSVDRLAILPVTVGVDFANDTHGGKVPRARCGFVVVFHTGEKIGRERVAVKLFYNLFLISCERSFERAGHGHISI